VDSLRLPLEILVRRTDDNASVVSPSQVKSHEVAAIPSQDGPTICRGNAQDFGIAGSPVRPA
jgi:hypothetical protein